MRSDDSKPAARGGKIIGRDADEIREDQAGETAAEKTAEQERGCGSYSLR